MIYVVSDTHFRNNNHAQERKKREDFDIFAKNLKKGDTLVLNGDFFDFYFESDRFLPKYYFPVFYTLENIKKRGIEIIYIPGNHDHWLGSFFESVDIEVKEEFVFEEKGKKFLITHGHWISAGKVSGFMAKLILTNPIHVFLFSLLPAEIGYFVADMMSFSSRMYEKTHKGGMINNRFLKKYIEKLRKERKRREIDWIIVGHFHYPYKEEGVVITGDFMNGRHYITIDNGVISMK